MKIIRLSLRVRLMIALSIAWAIGAGTYTRHEDVERADNFGKFAYKVCTDGKEIKRDTDLSSCEAERLDHRKTWMAGSVANTAIAALLPLPFFWLGGFILLYTVRAQIIGFRTVVPWATLTRWKKFVVVFCALASATAILFCAITVTNLYVDTKVPVALSPFLDVIKTGDNIVSVEGTWTRTDLTDDTIMNPLQTSKIWCNKSENRCTEALASVSGSVLLSDVVEYDVQSWTADAIVLRKDAICSTEVFTIDLNTKTVSGAGHLTDETGPMCRRDKDTKDNWTYQMIAGFTVYWGLRQKARPAPLRVFQSIFGN